MDHFAQGVCALLQLAATLGKVILVTLAKWPWVRTSCKNFAPAIGKEVDRLDVPVVYAQNEGSQVDYDKAAMMSSEEVERHWSIVKGRAISKEVEKFYSQ